LFGPSIILLLLSFIFLFFPLFLWGGAADSSSSIFEVVDCSVVGAICGVADGIAGSITSSELEEALSFFKSSDISVSDGVWSITSSKLELEEALSFCKSLGISVSDGVESIDGEKPLQAIPLSSW
jgi:hypothetical protein